MVYSFNVPNKQAAGKVPYLLYPDTRQAGLVGRQIWVKFYALLIVLSVL